MRKEIIIHQKTIFIHYNHNRQTIVYSKKNWCIVVRSNLNIASFLQLRTKVNEPMLLALKNNIDFVPKLQVIVIKDEKVTTKI